MVAIPWSVLTADAGWLLSPLQLIKSVPQDSGGSKNTLLPSNFSSHIVQNLPITYFYYTLFVCV